MLHKQLQGACHQLQNSNVCFISAHMSKLGWDISSWVVPSNLPLPCPQGLSAKMGAEWRAV